MLYQSDTMRCDPAQSHFWIHVFVPKGGFHSLISEILYRKYIIMTSVSTTETIQEEADIVRTMIDKLESRLGPSSRPRLGAFESSPEALSGAINFGIIVTVRPGHRSRFSATAQCCICFFQLNLIENWNFSHLNSVRFSFHDFWRKKIWSPVSPFSATRLWIGLIRPSIPAIWDESLTKFTSLSYSFFWHLISLSIISCWPTRSNERSLTFVVFLFLAFPGFLPQLLYTAQKCIENYVTKGYIIDLSLMEYWAQDWYLAIALQIVRTIIPTPHISGSSRKIGTFRIPHSDMSNFGGLKFFCVILGHVLLVSCYCVSIDHTGDSSTTSLSSRSGLVYCLPSGSLDSPIDFCVRKRIFSSFVSNGTAHCIKRSLSQLCLQFLERLQVCTSPSTLWKFTHIGQQTGFWPRKAPRKRRRKIRQASLSTLLPVRVTIQLELRFLSRWRAICFHDQWSWKSLFISWWRRHSCMRPSIHERFPFAGNTFLASPSNHLHHVSWCMWSSRRISYQCITSRCTCRCGEPSSASHCHLSRCGYWYSTCSFIASLEWLQRSQHLQIANSICS